MTASDLISAALQRILVIEAGSTPNSDDIATGLLRLNDLIDSWATERLLVYTVTRTTWTIAANTASYTVGTGATISCFRPTSPQDLTVKYRDTNLTNPVEIQLSNLTDDAYAAIPIKTLTSVYPTTFYYNPTYGSTGFGTLTLWMIPTSTTLQGVIYAPTPVTQLALSDTISLPPGWQRMLRENLALELCPDFNVTPSSTMIQVAMESKANVKRSNERFSDLSVDAALLSRARPFYNIYTDGR